MGPTKAPPAAWQGPEDLEEIRLTANLINRFEHRNSDTPTAPGDILQPADRPAPRHPAHGIASTIGNVLWFLLAGWWLAIAHLVTGVLLCLTIVGIPLGLANFKLIPVSLTPLGREIVDVDDAHGAEGFGH